MIKVIDEIPFVSIDEEISLQDDDSKVMSYIYYDSDHHLVVIELINGGYYLIDNINKDKYEEFIHIANKDQYLDMLINNNEVRQCKRVDISYKDDGIYRFDDFQ